MAELKEIIVDLSKMMSITGYEFYSKKKLCELVQPYFDDYVTDNVGNHIFIKKCGIENAPKLLLDAHFDEIGMLVTEIKDNGFLKVINLGGIDTRIMLASEVIIYGKEVIHGIVASKPPHLQNSGDSKKLPAVTELLIDTGYSKENLEKIVTIGTPVGFKPIVTELLNNCIAGKGFDNKACVAIVTYAVSLLEDKKFNFDIYFLCSSKEEIGLLGGKIGAYSINPDYAIVLDVNLAYVPDTDKHKTVMFGDGPALSYSAVNDRKFTNSIVEFAKQNQLKYQTVVEISSTGTNANIIPLINYGIPTAIMSLPLKNMHTCNEVISIDDALDTAKLLSTFIAGGLLK